MGPSIARDGIFLLLSVICVHLYSWCEFSSYLLFVLRCESPVVDSLFNAASIVCGGSVLGPCFIMQYLVPFLFLQSQSPLDEEERAGWFT